MPRDYYALLKPGIIYGNAITAAGGFMLAAGGHPDWLLLLATLVGLSLVIGSGCVFNNCVDRDIDALMQRTQSRPLVRGTITFRAAFVYGAVVGLAGFAILLTFTNIRATLVALFGFVAYVFVYSLWAKRRTVYGTHLGALSGAVPPVVGYVAVANRLDLAALILFLILFFWQMPHFFAIAIRREEDYRGARIPALPLVRSAQETRLQIRLYIFAFLFAALSLWYAGFASATYAVAACLLGLFWLMSSLLPATNERVWAARIFSFSLIVLTLLSVAWMLSPITP